MSGASSVLVVGLKGSGKTSYLAALWHSLESEEVELPLRIARLQPDRTYLNRIREAWLKCEEVGRTSIRGEERISLHLHQLESNKGVDVTLPDLSGESVRLQWSRRRATVEYAEFAAKCDGLLLFVHPEDIKTSRRINAEVEEVDDIPNPLKPWNVDQVPTQVQLVELIQFVSWLRARQASLKIAVLVSAWDRVQSDSVPDSWIERRLPLLHQFLSSNRGLRPWRAYGVSALGGGLENAASLLKNTVPSTRPRVVEGGRKAHHDLTAPLAFVLDLGSSK